MLPGLLNLSKESFALWAAINQDSHFQITQAIGLKGTNLPLRPLSPVLTEDFNSWLWRHQEMHNEMNEFLGIQGNDLSDLDFKDDRKLKSWIAQHYDEHYQAANQLGLG